jgi:hypothetical protein
MDMSCQQFPVFHAWVQMLADYLAAARPAFPSRRSLQEVARINCFGSFIEGAGRRFKQASTAVN